ncbi:MAG: CHC2 zinc finger domain-containing protein [Alphaproteobacteria bacterium]|nr:CHC2 zinc finger domain-containing protein [Alphaproteobacteria bacterium]
MAFPSHFLDEIRTRLAVSDVVARKVKLTRRGREFVGLSPFNKEKTPSFTVNDEKGFFHCFSSGEHGDIFGFLMKTEGLSFPEAVEKLAAEAGLDVPHATPEEQAREKQRAGLADVTERARPIGLPASSPSLSAAPPSTISAAGALTMRPSPASAWALRPRAAGC